MPFVYGWNMEDLIHFINTPSSMANRPTTYSTYDAEHWVPETWSKSHTRTDFERDRARLINSSAFRRLGEKTQIDMAGLDLLFVSL